MSAPTPYDGLSDDELLRALESRDTSPIIKEAAKRLNLHMGKNRIAYEWIKECPVCEAKLSVETCASDCSSVDIVRG